MQFVMTKLGDQRHQVGVTSVEDHWGIEMDAAKIDLTHLR